MLMEKEESGSESSKQEETCSEDEEVEVPLLKGDLFMVIRMLESKKKEKDET